MQNICLQCRYFITDCFLTFLNCANPLPLQGMQWTSIVSGKIFYFCGTVLQLSPNWTQQGYLGFLIASLKGLGNKSAMNSEKNKAGSPFNII